MTVNRLNKTNSPYLLQHAENPVHWQPWDAAALAAAKEQDKVILLSIGYAACHWCHVMEHESFTDAETAALMNAHFVNIKVDREERPDLDRIYQAAHYIFTRANGGWPLTMFLTPAGEPFFGGTYFPNEARGGLPSFSHVLRRVFAAWDTQRDAILRQNTEVLRMLRGLDDAAADGDALTLAPCAAAVAAFDEMFDRTNGGFRGAPKFPHPVELSFCLDAAVRDNNSSLLSAVELSLNKIAGGGLADHISGGFFRYCVDGEWQTPHFEKMLYDNGLLLSLFADAQTVFAADAADSRLRETVEKTADWALQEMHSENGCFYSSLDADSAGGEGDFYLWDKTEIAALLTKEEYSLFSRVYALDNPPNVEGKWHLARQQTAAAEITAETTAEHLLLTNAEKKLATARESRNRPATDDKILTAWNALLIHGLARAGRLTGREDWRTAATAAFSAVNKNMRKNGGGRLISSRRGNNLGDLCFLDDVAFLLNAALELLRADFSAETLATAQNIAEELREHFEDKEQGGFFFTANDGERLIRRPKPSDDGAIPSGNGIAARALLLLSWLTGDNRWHDTAQKSLNAFYPTIRRHPAGCASFLSALQFYCNPPTIVLLNGEEKTCKDWQTALEQHHNPDLLIYRLPQETKNLPTTLQKPPPKKGAQAYVCTAFTCRPPVGNLPALKKILTENETR